MSVAEKRERVELLKREIEERKAAHSTATSEASEAIREARLDREITRLERELAILGEVPEPTGELSQPEVRGPHDINLSGEVRKDELKVMADNLGIEGTSSMKKDELIDAIRETTGIPEEEGNG